MGAAPGRSDESHQDPDGDGRPPEAARLRDKVQADPAKDKHEQERIVGSVARGPQSRKGPGSSPSEGEALGVGRRGRGSRRGQWSWAERVHASQWGQPGGRTLGRHCSWVPSSGRSLPWQGNVPTGCTGDRLHSPCTKPSFIGTPRSWHPFLNPPSPPQALPPLGLAGQEAAVGKHPAREASLAAPGPSRHPPTELSSGSLPATLLG